MPRALPVALTGALLLLAPAPARAATQATLDPEDAYALATGGRTDVRSVEWQTENGNVTATVRVEPTTQFAVFLFLDVDRDGRADFALDLDGASGLPTFDAELWPVAQSTKECQLHHPGSGPAPVVDQQPPTATDADGFTVLTVKFPGSAVGGAGAWTWGAFGLTQGTKAHPPGWDYVPDATNPDPSVPQPAARTCTIDQVPGSGVRLDLGAGVPFPTPEPSDGAPVAAFGFSPAQPLSGDTVTFTSSSSDPEGGALNQRWDLDADGQYDDATGPTATRAFPRRGPQTVRLLVEDVAGNVTTTSRVVPVGNRPPVITETSATPPSPFRNQEFTLLAAATDDGQVARFAWDLDRDGEFDDAEGAAVVRSEPTRGAPTYRVRITDDDGASSEGSVTVPILNRPPVAALRIDPARPRARQGFVADATASSDPEGDPLTYDFDFGDGRFVRIGGPTYRMSEAQPGRVRMRVRVTDVHGDSDVAVHEFSFLPPPPPTVTITGPDPGRMLFGDQLTLTGTWTGWGGGQFCAGVGDAAPEPCDDLAALRSDGTFSLPVRGLAPGVNRVTVYRRDAWGQLAMQSVDFERVGPESGLDLRVATIEVTQGSQYFHLPEPRDPEPGAERVADYNGVRLAAGGPTYARVFVNARSLPRGMSELRGAQVMLHGFAGNRELRGGPLSPMTGPDSVVRGPLGAVGHARRADPRGGFLFELPDSWTDEREIKLNASVNPDWLRSSLPECATCREDNVFQLNRVRFFEARPVIVTPFDVWFMRDGAEVHPRSPGETFEALQWMLPGGPTAVFVPPAYLREINATTIATTPGLNAGDIDAGVVDMVGDWQDALRPPGHPIGVYFGLGGKGRTEPVFFGSPVREQRIAAAEGSSPILSAAHEVLHQLGARHASHCRTPTSGDPGDIGGILAEGWPPDEQGLLQGYALDLRPSSRARDGSFRVLGPSNHDLMSYCAVDNADVWISPRTFNRLLGGPRDQTVAYRARGAAVEGPALRVSALVRPDGTAHILRVHPSGSGEAAAPGDKPWRIVVRGADGAVVSTTPAGGGLDLENSGVRLVSATVPAAGAQSIELTDTAGTILTRRTASPGRPTVNSVRARVVGRDLVVRWTAADPDGGEDLEARVDVAADGRRFASALLGARGTTARIPLARLTGGRRARVRVTVRDGFHAATADSPPFAFKGGPTMVRILSPAPGSRLTSDAATVLRAEAADPSGRRRSVSWFAGRRKLGSGRAVTAQGLPAGRVTLRAVAPDGSADTVRVRVAAVAPRLIALEGPARVPRRGGRVVLRLAANQPGVRLTVVGKRFRLDRRVRRVALRVPAGRDPAVLRLRLRAGRRTATIEHRIMRR